MTFDAEEKPAQQADTGKPQAHIALPHVTLRLTPSELEHLAELLLAPEAAPPTPELIRAMRK